MGVRAHAVSRYTPYRPDRGIAARDVDPAEIAALLITIGETALDCASMRVTIITLATPERLGLRPGSCLRSQIRLFVGQTQATLDSAPDTQC